MPTKKTAAKPRPKAKAPRPARGKDEVSAVPEQKNGFSERLCYSLVADFLRDVDLELIEMKSVRFLADYPWKAGKRLRPMIFVLSNLAVRVDRSPTFTLGRRERNLAAAIELMHEASLVHDDIVDRSVTRRGVPTVHVLNGEGLGLLIGDYMIFRGLKLVLDAAETREDIFLAQELANTGLAIAHGEADQLDRFINQRDLESRMSLNSYLGIIAKKTAAFFAGCAEAGAAMAGASVEIRHSFREFGMCLGIVFQIKDDLMDVLGNPSVAKKTLRNNLREGTVTLPTIFAREVFPKDPAWRRLANQQPLATADEERLYRLFGDQRVLAKCHALITSYVEQAESHLAKVPRNVYRLALADLMDYVKSFPWAGSLNVGKETS